MKLANVRDNGSIRQDRNVESLRSCLPAIGGLSTCVHLSRDLQGGQSMDAVSGGT